MGRRGVAVAAVIANFCATVLCSLGVAFDVTLLVSAPPVESGHCMALDGLLSILSPTAIDDER